MAVPKDAKVVNKQESWCCFTGRKGFPTFAVIILVLAVLWILSDMGIIAYKISWFPVVLLIIAIGWIIDNYRRR